MMLSKKLYLSLFLVFPVLTFSQESGLLKPGSKIIDGSFIQAYTNKWKVVVELPDGSSQDALIWTDYGQIMDINGEKYLHRVQDLYSPNYNLVDTWINMVELKTMKPWQFQAVSPTGSVSYLEFFDESIRSNSNRNQDRVMNMDTLDILEIVFDWNLYGMLLVALPFEVGKTYELQVWLPNVNEVGTVLSKIEAEETIITLSNKKFDTFRISTDKGLTFWLTKKAPYVIQLQLNQPNGARRMWYMF
jgi:hypothetical protein